MICLCYTILCGGQTMKRVETHTIPNYIENNNGLAVADYDQDGDLDIFIVAEETFDGSVVETWSRLLRNDNNGRYTDVTQIAGFNSLFNRELTGFEKGELGDKMGASWGDYNNDGFPDIFLTGKVQSQLYKNNGDGTFSNVTSSSGFDVQCQSCYLASALWWDYNNDGFLDIFLVEYNRPSESKLYKNNGNETFSFVDIGLANTESFSLGAAPLDFNKDGILDLYVANDFDGNNFLFLNNGNDDFSEVALDYGVEDPHNGMGIGINDYNNDGLFDFFVANIKNNAFFKNTENGFDLIGQELGIYDTEWAWDASFFDFNLDGYEDLFITTGFVEGQENYFFKNVNINGNRGFERSFTDIENIQNSKSRTSVPFDYDNDGDLDLIVTNFDEEPYFYENTLQGEGGSPKTSLKVALIGVTSNRDGIGAVIEVVSNGNSQYRLHTGVNYMSQSLMSEHFGLNSEPLVETLKVTWPSGIIDTFNNINSNSLIVVTEGQGYTSSLYNPANKIPGCTDPNSCNYNPDATTDDGSCVYLEAGTISGVGTSEPLQQESYTYTTEDENPTYNWKVTNGKIISGQGTETIVVQWNFALAGVVSLVHGNQDCSSESVDYPVEIRINRNQLFADNGDFSIARLWNEVLLEAIRLDYARPTVHARNLFHTSIAMYDSWAVYNDNKTYLLGNEINGFASPFQGFEPVVVEQQDFMKTISYATYRILSHRFKNSPNATETQEMFNSLMELLEFDTLETTVDYSNGDAIALGNYIAQTIIDYGMQDGAQESDAYGNSYYEALNEPLRPTGPGNPDITDPNRWQALLLDIFIDQSGNVIRDNVLDFLSPEWGDVYAFAMNDDDETSFSRDGNTYKVFKDPGAPPYLDANNSEESNIYKWGFSLVSVWGGHLSPYDGVSWDISPKSIGNIPIETFPTSFSDYDNFYNLLEGGDIGTGRTTNPITGLPYEEQMVPRGDYARVLAEFWADGPDSETPPGHWFTLLNYVSDHPMLEKRLNGEGEVMENLEWDIKSYFILGGAMHDAAISAWSIKGWYDYIRPISSIRYMADKGQSTNMALDNYDPEGLPLITNYIEVVENGDALAGDSNENVGKIKVYSWRGHEYIENTATDEAGVDWILAENWWPYQRPSFVTPPFAGYVSGHSTYSRAAAEIMTMLTGSEFFPGGMGEFVAEQNEFLVFEEGPSQDIVLQWATYRDASDQCSLSRIWGGIHPPMDDIPGRIIGEEIGKEAFDYAVSYFVPNDSEPPIVDNNDGKLAYPNPIESSSEISLSSTEDTDSFILVDMAGKTFAVEKVNYNLLSKTTTLNVGNLSKGLYVIKNKKDSWKILVR